jgi:hypothetical protein
MDKSRMGVSAHIGGRQISDNPAATRMPSRLARRSFLVVVGFAMAGGLLSANTARAVECDTLAQKQQCCKAKDCGGKVLSNRDAHNCKDKSKGKSWHRASDGKTAAQCGNL